MPISRSFFASDSARLLDQAARRYGCRPSQMLGLTDPRAALAFDLGIADHCRHWELEHDQGEFWWRGVMKAFGGK